MFSLLTFFKGFNIFDGEKLGKLIFYAILITTGLTIYHQLTRDTTRTIINTSGDVKYFSAAEKKQTFFGCSAGPIGLGLNWK